MKVINEYTLATILVNFGIYSKLINSKTEWWNSINYKLKSNNKIKMSML